MANCFARRNPSPLDAPVIKTTRPAQPEWRRRTSATATPKPTPRATRAFPRVRHRGMFVPPSGPHHDLDAVVLFVVEFPIPVRGFAQAQPMRNRKGGVDLALLDQIHQRLHVLVHVRLAHLERER